MTTESAWFAARPSGTEDVYKIYAESFRGPDHLARCSPVVLPLSRQTRLARLHKHATYRQGPQQLVLPLWTGRDAPDLATQLADLLLDLVPVPAPDRVADPEPAESSGGPVAS